jgi:hypothetical protein
MTADAAPEKVRKVLDTAAVLADLAEWWGDIMPSLPRGTSSLMLTAEQQREARSQELGGYVTSMAAFRSGGPKRIAGGKCDQAIPEGTQNPYWEIIRQLPLDDMPMSWPNRLEPMLHWFGGGRGEYKHFADRFDVCGTYSWAICTPGDMTWMKEILGGRGVVEPGAGSGYWAWQMEQAGIDVAAYEPNEQGPGNHFARRTWTALLRDDHSVSRHHPDRALFLCWPSYAEPWAAQSLACYTGDLLIYCGEGEGGCTADDGFFELRDAEWEEITDCPAHVSFWGIHDYLTAYRRKGTL